MFTSKAFWQSLKEHCMLKTKLSLKIGILDIDQAFRVPEHYLRQLIGTQHQKLVTLNFHGGRS